MRTHAEVRAGQAVVRAVLRERRGKFVASCTLRLVRSYKVNIWRNQKHRNATEVQRLWDDLTHKMIDVAIKAADHRCAPEWLPAQLALASANVIRRIPALYTVAEEPRFIEGARHMLERLQEIRQLKESTADAAADNRFEREADFAGLMLELISDASNTGSA